MRTGSAIFLCVLLAAATTGSVPAAMAEGTLHPRVGKDAGIHLISLRRCNDSPDSLARVQLGADVLLADSLHLLQGRRIGLLCNHSTRLGNGRFLLDTLRARADMHITAIFTPEHGFRGSADAGAHVVSHMLDGIPVHSLYGATRRPSAAMLKDIDVLVMDVQDIGVRYYTYVSTVAFCMEEAAAAGIPVVLLDRPNPLGGERVRGPVMEDSLRSFVGYFPVPVRHGMTMGELARMAVAEGWLRDGAVPALHVIPMRGWRRSMYHDDTGLPWIAPSPNIPMLETALAYVGTCLFEGSSVSEARGTDHPFLQVGAPFVHADTLATIMRAQGLPGVRFEAVHFVPTSRPGATRPRYEGQSCGGVRLRITDRRRFDAWHCGVQLLQTLRRLHGEKVTMTSYLITLAGDVRILDIPSNAPIWTDAEAHFAEKRIPYLLYP
ncbi:MAG: DUF1343 domain-containing protein [Bacteroidetes bacterium]|nr:DUF1343 domain-containing protein [Bacteroidota bacterium]